MSEPERDVVRAYKDVIGELTAATEALRKRDRQLAVALERRLVELAKVAADAEERRRWPGSGPSCSGNRCWTRCGRSRGCCCARAPGPTRTPIRRTSTPTTSPPCVRRTSCTRPSADGRSASAADARLLAWLYVLAISDYAWHNCRA